MTTTTRKNHKTNSAETTARVLKTKNTLMGKNTRGKGHLSATVRRAQARRDARNA